MNIKLACRNIFRNPRRTTLTLLAISFGCASLIINGGIIYFIFRGLREDAIHGRYGHIQIHHRGFTEKHQAQPFDYTISSAEFEEIKLLLGDVEHVEEATGRLEFAGLMSYGGKNVSFLGYGVEADRDARLNTMISIVEGEGLSAEEPRGVILGKGLAARLQLRAGDFATLLVNTRDGDYNAVDVRVRGIFEGGLKEFDDWVMKIPLEKAQELLAMNEIQSVVVLLDKTENTEAARELLLRAIADRNLDLEMTAWLDHALFYNQVVSMFGKELDVVKVIISIIVILSIINSLTMSIFERTREIGAIMAIGAGRSQVMKMLALEGLLLGVIGGLIGVAAGIAIGAVISYIGIPMPPPPASTRPFTAQVDIIPAIILSSFLIAVSSSVLASIYPAYRASRLRIVDALRYV
jgi:putative ABC transport system permease protein